RLSDLDLAPEDLLELRLVEVDGPLEDPVPLAALHEDAVELAGVEGASGFPAGGHFVVDGPSEAPRPVFERGIRPGVGPELFEDVLDGVPPFPPPDQGKGFGLAKRLIQTRERAGNAQPSAHGQEVGCFRQRTACGRTTLPSTRRMARKAIWSLSKYRSALRCTSTPWRSTM